MVLVASVVDEDEVEGEPVVDAEPDVDVASVEVDVTSFPLVDPLPSLVEPADDVVPVAPVASLASFPPAQAARRSAKAPAGIVHRITRSLSPRPRARTR
ncbi:MAG: hypothetical protein H6711_34795 [Myxococcales bacterium]|nr:hypothetical protein [Myxococcales bacterium]